MPKYCTRLTSSSQFYSSDQSVLRINASLGGANTESTNCYHSVSKNQNDAVSKKQYPTSFSALFPSVPTFPSQRAPRHLLWPAAWTRFVLQWCWLRSCHQTRSPCLPFRAFSSSLICEDGQIAQGRFPSALNTSFGGSGGSVKEGSSAHKKHLLCISKKEFLQVIQERKKWDSSFVQQCDIAVCTAR